MWLTDQEKLGLQQLCPPAYACRSAEELVTVIGPVCTFISVALGCIVAVHGRLDEGVSFFALGAMQAWLTLVLAAAFSAGELVWLKHQQVKYDACADDYVRDAEPMPWRGLALRLVHAALFTAPGRIYDCWRNGPFARVSHLQGVEGSRALDLKLQRGGRALVEVRNETGELGAHGFATVGSWGQTQEPGVVLISLYQGKQQLRLVPQLDGGYTVEHLGAIRVRAWTVSGLNVRPTARRFRQAPTAVR